MFKKIFALLSLVTVFSISANADYTEGQLIGTYIVDSINARKAIYKITLSENYQMSITGGKFGKQKCTTDASKNYFYKAYRTNAEIMSTNGQSITMLQAIVFCPDTKWYDIYVEMDLLPGRGQVVEGALDIKLENSKQIDLFKSAFIAKLKNN